jgi:serine phosphatase RsbU (regulator of sigma subunit)
MPPRYRHPRELVEALQQQGDGARVQLHELLHAPLSRLMEQLRLRYRLQHKAEALTRQALHAAETYLRTRSPDSFASLDWPAFRAAVLLHVAKLASQPHGQYAPGRLAPEPLPRSPRYASEVLFLPYERVGDYWFGGDWFGGWETPDSSLWIVLADITGHGYHAYLLASILPAVWRHCWQSVPNSPAKLLAAMHDLLEECLPEGVYVECTLAQLCPDGTTIVAPAGGSRLLLRRGPQDRPTLLTMRGAWLGLLRPRLDEQQTWTLDDGDELLLATDGLFDQLHELGALDVTERLAGLAAEGGLFPRVRQLLQQALEQTPQKDDITMVLLRRLGRGTEAAAPARIAFSSTNGCRDVSV